MAKTQPFPKTHAEMIDADYVYCNQGTCTGCGAKMEWWRTPTGAKMPMNPMLEWDAPASPHWATCPEANKFRKKKPAASERNEQRSIHIVQ